jgi:tetratricopeptide (TPR) repeat protein
MGSALDPQYFAAFNNRAYILLSRQEFNKAMKDFDEAIRLHPDYPSAYNRRAQAYRALGQQAKADADAAKARQADPQVPPR